MSQPRSPYAGRTVALATRHGKERVIGRALRHGLAADLLHLAEIDTDALGSFCGTVGRRGSALQACRAKAELALIQGGTGLAIASEGSFGPHPAVPLLAIGVECLVFLDPARGLSLKQEQVARRTNFSQRQLDPPAPGQAPIDAGLQRWLQQVGFPRHGLLVRPLADEAAGAVLAKGIHDVSALEQAIRQASDQAADGRVQLETDMRAHCNPTRMASIRRLSFQLARRLATPCPACGSPGWGRVGSASGLPCRWCGLPTALTRSELLGCPCCDHRQERPRADGVAAADPQHCGHCNP